MYSVGNYGEVVNVELAMDRAVSSFIDVISWSWGHLARYRDLKLVSCLQVNIPRGYGYVEFKTRVDAEKAQLFMDGVGFFLFGFFLGGGGL